MDILKIDAVLSLVPNAKCVMRGGVITVWNSEETQPTEEEITAEQERLQAEYDAKQYARDRAVAYKSIQDQLDMQYWDEVNGTTTWKDHIAQVKADNPKP
jgi:hypothetical protein